MCYYATVPPSTVIEQTMMNRVIGHRDLPSKRATTSPYISLRGRYNYHSQIALRKRTNYISIIVIPQLLKTTFKRELVHFLEPFRFVS